MNDQLKCLAFGWVILWLAVFPSGAGAKSQQDCLKLKKIRTTYDALEPGRSYELSLQLKSRSGDCAVPLEIQGQTLQYRPSVHLDSAAGLHAEWIGRSYSKLEESRPAAEEMTLILKVMAAAELHPGEYSITALVDYATLSRDGTVSPQRIILSVPVKVVAAGASVKVKPEDNWNPAQLLLVPLRLLQGIGEILSGPNGEGW